MPGLSADLFRLVSMTLPPILGRRGALADDYCCSSLRRSGGRAGQSPTRPLLGADDPRFRAGVGGSAFPGFMPSTSYFFPTEEAGHRTWESGPGLGDFGAPSFSCSRRT